MSQVFTILYEESTPSRQKIAYYDSVATAAGLELKWQSSIRTLDDYAQLANGTVDGILVTARDNFQALASAELNVLVSGRGERRLVALFSSFIDWKNGEHGALKLSGEYDWQQEMVSRFLVKALPFRRPGYTFELIEGHTTPDERLYAVLKGETDVAVFSMADLDMHDPLVSTLRFMVLPLFECPPAIYQGTTAMIIKTENELSVAIREHATTAAVSQYHNESFLLSLYPNIGGGVVHMNQPLCSYTYFAGIDANRIRTKWKMEADLPAGKRIFSTTEFMKDFFNYEYNQEVEALNKPIIQEVEALNKPITQEVKALNKPITQEVEALNKPITQEVEVLNKPIIQEVEAPNKPITQEVEALNKPIIFVASHKAIHSENLKNQLQTRRVWAAGTRTWFELAKLATWVEGSADGLGLETLVEPWLRLLSIDRDDVAIVTNEDSARHWNEDGWKAIGTYRLVPSLTDDIIAGVTAAEFIFWTSYQQYEACRTYLPPGVRHASPAGKTAVLLQKDGVKDLVVFPSIKAYTWLTQKMSEK